MQRIALLESEKRSREMGGGSAASIALHVVVLAFAIAVTSHAGAVKRSDAVYVPLPPWRPEVRMVSPSVTKSAPSTTPHVRSIAVTVPSVIPPVIPEATISAVAPETIGNSSAAGTASQQGTDTAGVLSRGDSPYAAEEVDVAASVVPGQRGPAYPEALRMMGVDGRVVARFIIGKNGRVESDPTIVSASDDQFANSVKRYLTTARYRPATKNGEPVRQLAEQEFDFTVRR